jgi:hypothetical protein
VVVLYSESLGDAGGFRWLLGLGQRVRFRALVETPRLVRAVPDVREFGGHLLELRPERSRGGCLATSSSASVVSPAARQEGGRQSCAGGRGQRRKRPAVVLAATRIWSAPAQNHVALAAERRATMDAMAVAPKRLSIGDVVEIDGRKYDVVPDKAGGVTLEPAITQTVAEIHAEHGGRPLTSEEFDELFGDLPREAGCG